MCTSEILADVDADKDLAVVFAITCLLDTG